MTELLKADVKSFLWEDKQNMEPIDMYAKLITAQSGIHETITELLSMLSVCHKDRGSSTKFEKKVLANILKKCKDRTALKCINFEYNKRKFYIYPTPCTEENLQKLPLKDEIDIDNLDPATIYDLLSSIKGFPTYKSKLNRRRIILNCKYSLHQQCCLACNHKCKVCGKKDCSNEEECHGEGNKCNHECHNCNEMKLICLHSSSVCCKKCKLCTYCGLKLTLNRDEQCDRLKLVLALEELQNFTQLFGTLTLDDCKEFLHGANTLPSFPTCRTWNELCEFLLQKYHDVLNFMSNKENFRRNIALTKEKNDEKKKVLSSMLDVEEDVDDILIQHHFNILKIIAFAQICYGEVDERQSIIRRLSDLNKKKEIGKVNQISVEETQNQILEKMETNKLENGSDVVVKSPFATEGDNNKVDCDNIEPLNLKDNVDCDDFEPMDLKRTQSINPFEYSSSSSLSSETSLTEAGVTKTDDIKETQQSIELAESGNPTNTRIDSQIQNYNDNKITLIEGNVNSILEELHTIEGKHDAFKSEVKETLRQTNVDVSKHGEQMEERIMSQLSTTLRKFEEINEVMKKSHEQLKSELEEIKETQISIKEMLLKSQQQSNLKKEKKNGLFGSRIITPK